jgi:DNA gyrase subunit A
MYAANEKVIPVPIEEEMKSAYIDYAMSVIVGRALPDVRDGLKPVHRRILFAMNELGLHHNKPYRKSARIVGEVLGKFHPHGDVAVYDSLVRMAQTFAMRYPLVDGQGNFGSVDGDSAAAMRYTEARLAAISAEILKDIDKKTVAFAPNFDESMEEPTVLPCNLPNLLINGATGIAVGMATNIPPHNLVEVVSAIEELIDDESLTIKQLMKHIKGPDFPTGGVICGVDGIASAYNTGRGKILMRGRVAVEQRKNGKEAIIITEIPYQVNKANLIESIAHLVEGKKIEGISDIRDESDRDGMRVVIELKKDTTPEIIINQLYKHTQLQATFGVIMLALVENQPQVLNLKQVLQNFINHRFVVMTRRTEFELAKAEKRAHILEGLKIAFANLDKIIKIIRESKTVDVARAALMSTFKFSEVQAQAILEMQLQRLAALEREKIEQEYLELIKRIEYLKSLLESRKKMLGVVKAELLEVKKKFDSTRRTDIVAKEDDIEIEDLIQQEDVIITLSHKGYIKRIPVAMYRSQRRGGRGVSGANIKEEDYIQQLFLASTHDYLLFFTDLGKVYWRKTFEIPQASRTSQGRAIVNFLNLEANENITSLIKVSDFAPNKFMFMVTKQGVIKKTTLEAYSRPRSNGIVALNLKDKDQLIGCMITDGEQEIFLATKNGKAIRFQENEIREMGRTATGVRGIRLAKGDEVIAMSLVEKDGTILVATQNGYGKKTTFNEYRCQSRGGSGVANLKVTEKTGTIIGVITVREDDEVILATSSGMIVRLEVKGIRTIGRNTQGVRLINLKQSDSVASIARVLVKDDGDEEEIEEEAGE